MVEMGSHGEQPNIHSRIKLTHQVTDNPHHPDQRMEPAPVSLDLEETENVSCQQAGSKRENPG